MSSYVLDSWVSDKLFLVAINCHLQPGQTHAEMAPLVIYFLAFFTENLIYL